MSQTDEVATHLLHHTEIAPLHVTIQCHTVGPLVLMPAKTVELVGLAVEEEAFFGIHLYPPES